MKASIIILSKIKENFVKKAQYDTELNININQFKNISKKEKIMGLKKI